MLFFIIFAARCADYVPSADKLTLVISGTGIVEKEMVNKFAASSFINVIIKDNISEIGEGAFSSCSSMKKIDITDKVLYIRKEAFKNCYSLQSITIPEGTLSIEDGVFEYCEGLKTISIPKSCTSIIFINTFYKVYYDSITVNQYNTKYSTDENNKFILSKDMKTMYTSIGSYSVQIPNYIETIGSYCFNGKSNTKIITFEQTSKVTKIESHAFRFVQFTTLTLPSSVKIISSAAFGGSTLETLNLPSTLESVSAKAFENTPNLQTINIDGKCSAFVIEDGVFFDNGRTTVMFISSTTKELKITKGITTIYGTTQTRSNLIKLVSDDDETAKYKAFDNTLYTDGFKRLSMVAGGVPTIKIHSSCQIIEDNSFGYSKITEVNFDEAKALSTLSNTCFQHTYSLKQMTIPGTVTTIGSFIFQRSGLTSLIVPQSVTIFGDRAFSDCQKLTSVVFEGTRLKNVGERIFHGCINLNYLKLPSGLTLVSTLIAARTKISSIQIPAPVTSISDSAFYECRNLTTVEFLGNELNSIKSNAFASCSIASITFPASLKSIEPSAFKGNAVLSTVNLNEGLESISMFAFADCLLSSITIPDSLSSLSPDAFSGSANHTQYVTKDNPHFKALEDGVLYSKNGSILVSCPGGKLTADISSDISVIGNSAFYNCRSLVSVNFGEHCKVKSIGESTFYGCRSLTSLSIPGSVDTIEDNAFNGCEGIKKVTFKEGSKIKAINAGSFMGCKDLTSVEFESDSILEEIGPRSFKGCGELIKFVLPESVKKIGDSAFEGCNKIGEISLSNVQSIGSSAFKDCTALSRLKIPRNTTAIGDDAFAGCKGLQQVKYCGSTVIINSIFYGVSIKVFTIAEEYKSQSFGGLNAIGVLDSDCQFPTNRFTQSSSACNASMTLCVAAIVCHDEGGL